MRYCLFSLFWLAGFLCPNNFAQFLIAQDRPNIVVILADDLGAGDLACDGSDLHESPHLDRLASRGIRHTRAYAPSPVCTPSRASLLTGKHPARLSMTIWSEGSKSGPNNRKLLQAHSLHDLPHEEETLAERLKAAGWLTASIGKWHLGNADHAPETQGFDVNVGGTHWGAPHSFFWPYRGKGRFGNEFRYVPCLGLGRAGDYLTDQLTDQAIQFIDAAHQLQQPFFLLLAHHAPHTPIEAKQEQVAYFQTRVRADLRHRNATYAAMIASLDESVGRVGQRLSELGLLENTIIIFTSDNGGYIGLDSSKQPITDNSPLRSGKGSLYEGGIRVPLIVSWPHGLNRAAVLDQPVVLNDLFPTLTEITRTRKPTDTIDGCNLWPYWQDASDAPTERALYFHYPHYYHAPMTTPCSAVIDRQWKLIEYFEDGRRELFDLAEDPSESQDLASVHAEKTKQLSQQLADWRSSVNAQLPQPNPRSAQ